MKIKILYLNVYQSIKKDDIRRHRIKITKRIQARIKNKIPDFDGTIEQLLGCSLSFLLK